jgi:hypothetical protein
MSSKFTFSLHSQLEEQVNGKKNLNKLLCKRKKVPWSALHMWRYNRMREKDSIFFAPLIDGELVHDLIFPHGFS